MNQSRVTRLSNVAGYVIAFILVLLPFHEFITTWIGSNSGHLDLWRIWKEILIFSLIPLCFYLIYKSKQLISWFHNDWLVRLIILYGLLNIAIGIWSYKAHHVNAAALGDGLLIDLRFLVFFMVAFVVTHRASFLKKLWQEMLIFPAAIAVIFGLLQIVLPIDFLRHFGYGPKTIPAYETVDQKLKYHRIQSTLRGANPFGAYLILVLPAYLINLKKYRTFKIIMVVASLVALAFTYSRSAYIGVIVSVVVLYYLLYLKKQYRRPFVLICVGLVVVLGSLVVVLKSNHVAENVFFHTDSTSTSSTSSNAQRAAGLKTGIREVLHQPLGQGPGSAGPASAHNNQPARIAENYYVQVAQETGWLGLGLFIAINCLIVIKLYKRKSDPLACLLLASFVGISLVNMVSHAWADDTLSLLWWGYAGIMLTPAILKKA